MKIITIFFLLMASQYLKSQVTANEPSPYLICEYDTDGFANFDLNWKNAEIVGGQTDVMVTYHLTFSDAENGVYPIINSSNYLNITPYFQTIYPRVESIINGDYAITELSLIVGDIPNTNNPSPIILIDDNGDGFEIFDLTIRENEIADPTQNYIFSYFELFSDAENNVFALSNPTIYQNFQSPEQTLFVRVENEDTGCFIVLSLLIAVDTIPDVPVTIEDFVVYDENGDGVALFDLTLMIPQIVGDQTDLEVTFYETELDAQNKTNAVDDPEMYENISNPQTIYARTETVYGAFALTSFTIFADENLSSPSFELETLTFYPNPASDFIHLNIQRTDNNYSLEILNLNGQQVISAYEISQMDKINISRLKSGVYFLKITADNNQIIKKLVKK